MAWRDAQDSKKSDELDAFVCRDQLLAEKLHHLCDSELVVAQIYFYHFLAALETC